VHININGYLPPPGVHVYEESGRPYYVERERRIYLKKGHSKKHLKKTTTVAMAKNEAITNTKYLLI
jgi:hypothetical protein